VEGQSEGLVGGQQTEKEKEKEKKKKAKKDIVLHFLLSSY
jgi:hypothetical protein